MVVRNKAAVKANSSLGTRPGFYLNVFDSKPCKVKVQYGMYVANLRIGTSPVVYNLSSVTLFKTLTKVFNIAAKALFSFSVYYTDKTRDWYTK